MSEDAYWKIIIAASLSLLSYKVYHDYTESKRTSEKAKRCTKICLTGGPYFIC
jgi:hypothetical protein